MKIDALKIGIILAETIKISEKTTVLKNNAITTDILDLFQSKNTIDKICVYKTKKYFNAYFESPDDKSEEGKTSLINPNLKNIAENKKSVKENVTILEKALIQYLPI